MGHTPTPSENSINQTGTGTDRASRGGGGGADTETPQGRGISGIPNISKGSVPEVVAVHGIKDKNFK